MLDLTFTEPTPKTIAGATGEWELVIGMEIHAQVASNAKLFSGASTQFGAEPNSNVSFVDAAMPGMLPVINRECVYQAIRTGLGLKAQINLTSVFDRKNYFYADLPKGYQITQDTTPICTGGGVNIRLSDGSERIIRLTRIHMEEDTGKSLHDLDPFHTLIDLNRAGVPLLEIVSEADFRSGEEAYQYLSEVRKLVRYLDISDGNMEEGSLRCDVNISVRPVGQERFGTKVEVKNMNSFRNLGRAIDFEYERQVGLLEEGQEIISETRTFDADGCFTASMRTKEALNDYRYFPDPDLPPLVLSEEWIKEVAEQMPTLPRVLYRKFMEVYQLPSYDAALLTETREMAAWYESLCKSSKYFKAASNWIMGPVRSYMNEHGIDFSNFPLAPESLAQLIDMVEDGQVSFSSASQKIFPELILRPGVLPNAIAQQLNLIQESDVSFLVPLAEEVLAKNPEKVAEFKSGKKGLLGFFMGELMKKSQGKADPKVATQILNELLAN